MEYLKNLNEKQLQAALKTEGPVLVLAGAGSGKTSTMTRRIAHLIKGCGVNPYNILAVTFTNKAANEMKERVEDLLGGNVNMWIMTFHAACLRILRANAEVLGYSSSFVVYDPVDQKTVIKNIMKEKGIEEKKFPVNGILSAISSAKEQMKSPRAIRESVSNYKEEVVASVYDSYEKILKKNNAMDFDDLLLNTVKLFEKDERVLAHYQDRFKYIMVDEYQDTNMIQYKFISMLAEQNQNICVVGDDDQCIYQWRGADIRNILNFEKDFPGAEVIKLEQNYRSTGNILAAAHSVIEHNHQRKSKKLWTNAEDGSKIIYSRLDDDKLEAHYIAQEIDRLHRVAGRYGDFAILYRTNAQSRTFEEALGRRGVPYRVVGGTRYYDRMEIKDMVAYLRLVSNPADELALMRVINVPKRGIGNATVAKIKTMADVLGISMFQALKEDSVMDSLSAKVRKALQDFVDVIDEYHSEKENLRVSDIYDGLLVNTGYLKSYEDQNTVEAEGRIENLLEFKSVIFDYEEKEELPLHEFLEKIALLSDVDNHDADEDAVVLMTMHSAKGLEFPYVFMPGMEDGLFPSYRSLDSIEGIEEERRLCYVGMTRAKERLCLTSAGYRVQYGKGNFTRESQFLRELDPKLVEGDGILRRKTEARFGERKPFDGFSQSTPFEPFNQLKVAKREVKKKAKNTEVFSVGDRVSHAKFGEGTVVEISGNVARIDFDTAGSKKLATDIAPVKKI
ncbi:MAG: 3'-5' exonuclease [Eubacterium sp.]|nr:3'-5' exonuclease [Eubacterium sp.]